MAHLPEIAEIVRALAALLWPIVAAAALVMFRKELKDALSRLKRGKVLGQEFELGEELAELRQSVDAVERTSPESSEDIPTADEDWVDEVLREAANRPTVALMMLTAQLEREVRQLWAKSGLISSHDYRTLHQAIRLLVDQGRMSKWSEIALKNFQDVRNKIVHGVGARERDVLSAIDAGIQLAKAIRNVPNEINVVYHPGVQVFSDPECTKVRDGFLGLILETTSAGGASRKHRIYPTTKTDYRKGQHVSWEWGGAGCGESWYRDPDTGEVKYAWTDSMEFVGRPLESV